MCALALYLSEIIYFAGIRLLASPGSNVCVLWKNVTQKFDTFLLKSQLHGLYRLTFKKDAGSIYIIIELLCYKIKGIYCMTQKLASIPRL